jgi:glycosyltransferase involved in cell wall biosynthesis
VLVHLKRTELFESVIPSKIFEIMGAGRPVIMGVGGEAGALIREARAGILIEPENPRELVAAIERLRGDAKAAEEMGRAGREFVIENFDRERLAEKYLELLASLK